MDKKYSPELNVKPTEIIVTKGQQTIRTNWADWKRKNIFSKRNAYIVLQHKDGHQIDFSAGMHGTLAYDAVRIIEQLSRVDLDKPLTLELKNNIKKIINQLKESQAALLSKNK